MRIFRCCLFSLRRDLQIHFCVFLQWNHWFHQLFSETASNLVGQIDVRTRSTGPPRTWHPGCLVPCTSRRRTGSSTRLLTVQKVAPMTWLFSPALRFLWEIAGLRWYCVALSVGRLCRAREYGAPAQQGRPVSGAPALQNTLTVTGMNMMGTAFQMSYNSLMFATELLCNTVLPYS